MKTRDELRLLIIQNLILMINLLTNINKPPQNIILGGLFGYSSK